MIHAVKPSAALCQQHPQRLRSGRRNFAQRRSRQPTKVGRCVAATRDIDLLVDRFRTRPRLAEDAQRRSVDRGSELLDEAQGWRSVVAVRPRGNSDQAAIGSALLYDHPFVCFEFRIGESGELQERLVRGKLPQERKAIAATELTRLGQWNSVDVELARDSIEPRQRRMTKRGDESAVPPEGANINRDGGARAVGLPAHRHF